MNPAGMSRSRAGNAGLTLVEMLVVLVIVGLVSTLLVQGLGNALSLYSRVQNNQRQAYAEAMIHRWWRSSVSTAAPNRLDEPQKFLGQASRLEMQTHGALLVEEGVITDVVWEIPDVYPYRLAYSELQKEPNSLSQSLELRFESQQKPTFEYLSASGKWHREWPADKDKNDLPEAVRINLGSDYLHAAIRNRKDPIFYIDEVEFGRGN